MIAITGLLFFQGFDGSISFGDGVLLIVAFCCLFILFV